MKEKYKIGLMPIIYRDYYSKLNEQDKIKLHEDIALITFVRVVLGLAILLDGLVFTLWTYNFLVSMPYIRHPKFKPRKTNSILYF